MTQQSKEEKKEVEVRQVVPNWTFPVLPDKFNPKAPLSSQKNIKDRRQNEKQYE